MNFKQVIKDNNNHLPKYTVPGLLINPFNRVEVELNKNNMETKKVTLANGTVLEVGKTYEFDKFQRGDYFTMLFIGDYKMVYKYNNSKYNDGVNEVAMSIDNNLMIIPYTPPTPQKEWKTFLIEFSGIKYRAILQYETLEQAQFHHPNAISITEVRLNIEEVK